MPSRKRTKNSRKRTTTAAVTAKNRSRNKSGCRVGCPCKKCTTFKHDRTCTCKERGFDKLLTEAKMRSRGRKQDGGRVYLGMIDDESYYSPPVVAVAAAAAALPGPGGAALIAPDTYANIFDMDPNDPATITQLQTWIVAAGLTPVPIGPKYINKNKNILINHYYPGSPLKSV